MAWVDVTPEEAAAELKRINETKPPPLVPSNVAPNLAEMEAKQLEQGPVRIDPNFRPGIKIANPSEDAEFTKARQESAIQTPGFQRAAKATIPMIGAMAGMVPGLQGIPTQMALGAGSTYLNQLAGHEKMDPGDIVTQGAISGAIPLGAKTIQKLGRGAYKAAVRFIDPLTSRQAGTEAAVEQMGGIPNAAERALAPKASSAMYKAVEATADEVPTPKLTRAITLALNQMPSVGAPKAAKDYLEELHRVLDAEATLPYANIDKQINSMRKKAKDFMKTDTESGSAIMDARARIIAAMDEISPELSKANAAYRREHVVEKVYDAFTKNRADLSFSKLLLSDPLVKGIVTKADTDMLESIAKQMARIPASSLGEGRFGKLVDLFATPISAMAGSKKGITMLRHMYNGMGGGNLTVPALSSIAQFSRAWAAQEADRGGE